MPGSSTSKSCSNCFAGVVVFLRQSSTDSALELTRKAFSLSNSPPASKYAARRTYPVCGKPAFRATTELSRSDVLSVWTVLLTAGAIAQRNAAVSSELRSFVSRSLSCRRACSDVPTASGCLRSSFKTLLIFESIIKAKEIVPSFRSRKNSFFLHALNPGAKLLQLHVHLFIAAVQMINAVDLRRAFRRQPGDHQRRRRAQIARHHRRAAQGL